MKARPTRTPSDNNDAGQNDGVNPFTKTVFIVFGVLGWL